MGGRWMTHWVMTITLTCLMVHECHGFFEGIYCGVENCYEVLGLTRDAKKEEIVKSYRGLARKFHPDVHRGAEAKETAQVRFRIIASAYEVLRDEESRKEYDYMLDNPDEVYRHYYNYWRRRYAPKVDIRIVLVVTITLISVAQYYGSWSRYKETIDYFMTVPKYRMAALEVAKQEGITLGDKRKNRGKGKEEVKAEEEAIIRSIVENKMDIKGGRSKPKVKDVLWVQLILLPLTIGGFIYFHARRCIKFAIMGHELDIEEQEYRMRRAMGLSLDQWNQLEDEERDEFHHLQLWDPDLFKDWKQERDAETKAKLAESASYKRYRRWMKKGGAGQITFMED